MLKNVIKNKARNSSNYINNVSQNLFTLEILFTSIAILACVLMLAYFGSTVNLKIIFLLFSPLLYAACVYLNYTEKYCKGYMMYHITSYTIIMYLIYLYGSGVHFQLYFFSFGLSIFLYTREKLIYDASVLFVYVLSFAATSLFSVKGVIVAEPLVYKFLSFTNLLFVSIALLLKGLKYIDLNKLTFKTLEISQLKIDEMEEQLTEKQDVFNLFFESSTEGAELLIKEVKSNKVLFYDVNESLIEMLKMDKKTIMNKKRVEYSPQFQNSGKKSSEYEKELKILMSKQKRHCYRWDFYDGDGKIVNTEITEVRLLKNNRLANLTFCKNITAKLKAETVLVEREMLYSQLIENVYDGIKIDSWNKKTGNKIDQIINKKLLNLFKIERYSIEKDNYMDFIPEYQSVNKTSKKYIEELRLKFEQNNFVNFRMNFINSKKEPFTTDLTALRLESQETINIILIAKDITDIVKKEKTIKEQIVSLKLKNDELERYIKSNTQLKDFAFRASHDLKEPIATILTLADILKNKKEALLDDESQKYLNFIEQCASNLCLLIDDKLLFASAANNKINIQNINTKTTIEFVLLNLKSEIEKNEITISLGDLPFYINADPVKFMSLMQNLVSNSIKYRKKEIKTYINISGVENEDHFQFSISDNGIGIKEKDKTKIFEMYETVCQPSAIEKKVKSTGIGLSNCVQVVNLHKGLIWVDSVYGEGATFHFTISKNLNQIINN